MRATTAAFCSRYCRICSRWRRMTKARMTAVTTARMATPPITSLFFRPVLIHRFLMSRGLPGCRHFSTPPGFPKACALRAATASSCQDVLVRSASYSPASGDAEGRRDLSRMDEQVFRALLEEFYLECKERLAHIEEALVAAGSASVAERATLLVDARRELHTLKGNSGMMGLGELQQLAHRIEDRVGEWRPATLAGEQLREALADVDRFRRLLEKACGHASGVEEEGAPAEGQVPDGHVQESVRV